ncbi:MAG: helix-turn-helix transcriptional regulator, partial [Paracoccaceae bacterium]
PDLITLRPEISAHVLEVLNEREARFMELLLRGMQNKEIADETGVSDHLVKMILNSIFVKLGVRNRTQAVLVALGFEV